MGGATKNNSRNRERDKSSAALTARQSNIVTRAVRIIAGSDKRSASRAARIIGVSEPTVYRWLRTGNMVNARGADVLTVHELTGIPLETLLGSSEGIERSRHSKRPA